MNRLILKDGRGAVETVPSCKGIATLVINDIVDRDMLFVETVPSCKGIATEVPTTNQNNISHVLKLSRVVRALRLSASVWYTPINFTR